MYILFLTWHLKHTSQRYDGGKNSVPHSDINKKLF